MTHPDALASLLRSRELAEPALEFLSEDVRACYGPDYRAMSRRATAPATAPSLDRFTRTRRHLLARRPARARLTDAEIQRELTRPRALLVADWQRSVWDGTAAAVSAGFVDPWDIPGWDTWIGLAEVPEPASADGSTSRCLVSWVPIWAGTLVEEAIRVNPVGCLAWGTISQAGITARGWGQPWAGPST